MVFNLNVRNAIKNIATRTLNEFENVIQFMQNKKKFVPKKLSIENLEQAKK